ncbi:MAG: MFS transporter [Candidatus Helarchaeota archaeon]|nr:MFS transporter [Candidatus Helarchaeota archaeon]
MDDEINDIKPLDIKIAKIKFPGLFPLWIAVFIDILGFTLIIPFLPFFIKELTLPVPELQPIFDLFPYSPTVALMVGIALATNAVFGFFFGPILGSLSDKYGRRPLLLISQFGTLSAFVMLAFSTSYEMVLISRIIDGVFGGNFPIAKAVIGDVVPPKHRAPQMTNVGVAHVLASLFGPALGGFLYTRWGIIAPGLFSACLSLLTIIVTFFYLKESAPIKSHFQPKKENPIQNIPIKPTSIKPDVKSRPIWKNGLAMFLLIQWAFHTISFMVYISNIALFADIRLHMKPDEIGFYMSLSGIARLIIRFYIFEPTLKKFGDKRTSQIGLTCFVIAFFAMAFVQDFLQFLLVLMLVSYAASCSRGVLISFQSRSVSPKKQGKMGGLNTSLDNLAQIIGPLLGSFILGTFGSTWFAMVATLLAIAAFSMSFRPIVFQYEAKPSQKPHH